MALRLLILALLLPGLSAQSPREIEQRLSVTKGAERLVPLSELLSAALQTPVPNALVHGEEALRLLETYPDPRNEAVIRGYMSQILLNAGRSSEAIEQAERALVVAEESGDQRVVGECLIWLGSIAAHILDFDRAAGAFERARDVFDLNSDTKGQLRARNQLGNLSNRRGRAFEALEHFFDALEIAESSGDTAGMAAILPNTAFILAALGHHQEARTRMLDALATNRELGNQLNVGAVLCGLSRVSVQLGEPEAALTYARDALSVYEQLEVSSRIAESHICLAAAHLELEQQEDSLSHLKRALEIRQASGDSLGISEVYFHLGTAHRKLGSSEEAEQAWTRGLETARPRAPSPAVADFLLSLADLCADRGQDEEAVAHYRDYVAANERAEKAQLTDRIRDLEAFQSTAKAKRRLREVQRENAVKDQRLERQAHRSRLLVLGSLSLVVVVVLLVLVIRMRSRSLTTIRQSHADLEVTASRLADSERRYRSVFDGARSPRLLVDFEREVVLEVNRAAAALGLLGRPVSPSEPAGFESIEPDWLRNALASLEGSAMEESCLPTEWKDESGQVRFTEIWHTPISLGGHDRALLTLHDVTESRRLEEERNRRANLESLGLLAGGIAHDFNNSLCAIAGMISLAQLETENANEQARLFDGVEKAVRQSVHLTRQLLTFSKGGAPCKEPQDLGPILRDAALLAVVGSTTRVSFDISSDLRPAHVDGGQIQQVIHNLVLNADQAMGEGGHVTITATNLEQGAPSPSGVSNVPMIRIAVSDNGPGIPEEVRDRVFEPYFTTKKEGSGLGLAASFSILTRHGGWLDFESEVGSGTTFFLYIPATLDRSIGTAVDGPATLMRGAGQILVVEDDPMLQRLYESCLKRLGYEAVIRGDGGSAVEQYRESLARSRPFDLVILDLTIVGGLGGKTALAELRRLNPAVLAIVASGYSSDSVISDYSGAGFAAALVKPFTIRDLGRVLHTVLATPVD